MSKQEYKYVFGPVPSRRLGRSLGISPIPSKTCNFSCVYCQLGRTTNYTNTRKMFYPVLDIVDEVRRALLEELDIDVITIVGDGEPTLYKGLGELISELKKISQIPIAVITNGALLCDEEVRKEISKADFVLPTLDAPNKELFKKINRPRKELDLDKITEGMIKFRKIFSGQLWLELMLVKDLNDDVNTLKDLKTIFEKIQPDKIFINVPIRPPAEKWVRIPTTEKLQQALTILNAESIAHYEELLIENIDKNSTPEKIILEITQRHPLRDDQIFTLFPNVSKKEIAHLLLQMEKKEQIQRVEYNNRIFWQIKKRKIRNNEKIRN